MHLGQSWAPPVPMNTTGCASPHLLLTGAPYTPLEAEAGLPRPQRYPPRGAPPEGERAVYPERVEAMWSFVSAESRAVVASLLRPDPAERLVRDGRLRRMHMHTCMCTCMCTCIGSPGRRPLCMHVTRVHVHLCICARA